MCAVHATEFALMGPCGHGMARFRIADGGDGLQI
jgi:hypothetical protein